MRVQYYEVIVFVDDEPAYEYAKDGTFYICAKPGKEYWIKLSHHNPDRDTVGTKCFLDGKDVGAWFFFTKDYEIRGRICGFDSVRPFVFTTPNYKSMEGTMSESQIIKHIEKVGQISVEFNDAFRNVPTEQQPAQWNFGESFSRPDLPDSGKKAMLHNVGTGISEKVVSTGGGSRGGGPGASREPTPTPIVSPVMVYAMGPTLLANIVLNYRDEYSLRILDVVPTTANWKQTTARTLSKQLSGELSESCLALPSVPISSTSVPIRFAGASFDPQSNSGGRSLQPSSTINLGLLMGALERTDLHANLEEMNLLSALSSLLCGDKSLEQAIRQTILSELSQKSDHYSFYLPRTVATDLKTKYRMAEPPLSLDPLPKFDWARFLKDNAPGSSLICIMAFANVFHANVAVYSPASAKPSGGARFGAMAGSSVSSTQVFTARSSASPWSEKSFCLGWLSPGTWVTIESEDFGAQRSETGCIMTSPTGADVRRRRTAPMPSAGGSSSSTSPPQLRANMKRENVEDDVSEVPPPPPKRSRSKPVEFVDLTGDD